MRYTKLQDYPRPANDNRIGIHWNGSAYVQQAAIEAEIPLLQRCKIKWVKLVADGDGSMGAAAALARAGIEPIVRLYAKEPHPWFTPQSALVAQYVQAGAHYFEAGNEPNLIGENGEWRGAFNFEQYMHQVIRNKAAILNGGGIYLLDSLSPGGNSPLGQHAQMYDAIFAWLAAQGERLEDCGIACHPRPLNHPLDYPYDAINQAEHPGATTKDDSTCFLMVEDLDRRVRQLTGGRQIPLIATEHGCSVDDAQDNRYYTITPDLHKKRNVDQLLAAYKTGYIHNDYGKLAIPLPDSFFAGCSWIWGEFGHIAFSADAWRSNSLHGGNDLPAVAALEAAPAFLRYWHGGIPVQPAPQPPAQLRAWQIRPLPMNVIRVAYMGAAQVQQGGTLIDNPSVKDEPDFSGLEFSALGAGIWTVRVSGFTHTNVEVGHGKGALLIPGAVPEPVPMPQPQPAPTPIPQPTPAPQYTLEQGFLALANDPRYTFRKIQAEGNMWRVPDTGDAVQRASCLFGQKRRNAMLIWHKTTNQTRLIIMEAGISFNL